MEKEKILKIIVALIVLGAFILAKKILDKWLSTRNHNNILIIEPKSTTIPKLLYDNIEKSANEIGCEIKRLECSEEEEFIKQKMCIKGKKKTCDIQYWDYYEDIYKHEQTKFKGFTIIFATFDGNRLLNDEVYFNEVREYLYPTLKDDLLRNGTLTKVLCCYENEKGIGNFKYRVKDRFKDSSADEVIKQQINDIIFINRQEIEKGVQKNIIDKYI